MGTAVATITDFWDWLVVELADVGRALFGKSETTKALTVSLGASGQLFPAELCLGGKQKTVGVESIEELGDAVKKLSRRKGLECRIQIGGGRYFQRRIAEIRLPKSRAQNMADIDLAANTPFKRNDVYLLFPDKRKNIEATTYLAVKRTEIDPVLGALQKCGCPVSAVQFREGDKSISIDKASIRKMTGVRFGELINRWLLGACLAVLVAGLASVYAIADYKLSEADGILDTQIQAAQKTASAARKKYEAQTELLERMSSLRQEKTTTGATVTIWEQLSRILPDDTWLSDFTIDNGVISLSGYSTSAAAIVPLLERSGHFENPRFTASVNRVPGQNFERFTLQTSFKPAGAGS